MAAIPSCSFDACEGHFMALYRKINSFKKLTTTMEKMGKPAMSKLSYHRNWPPLSIDRFLKHYFTPEMRATFKRKRENRFRMSNKTRKDLPTQQKDSYMHSYKDSSKLEAELNSRLIPASH